MTAPPAVTVEPDRGPRISELPGPGVSGSDATLTEMAATPSPLSVSTARSVTGLLDATATLRAALEAHEGVCRRILEEVEADVPVGFLLADIGADQWRSSITGAIQYFEMSRHAVRLALVARSVEEGMSIADVARSWGVSRQLASRWVHEASDDVA